MSLEIEIMTTERNIEGVDVDDLTEKAIQRCFLKQVFFKEIRIVKTNCVYNYFKKKL